MSESQGPGGGALEPTGTGDLGHRHRRSTTVHPRTQVSSLRLLRNALPGTEQLGSEQRLPRGQPDGPARRLPSVDSNDQPINYRPWEKPTNGNQTTCPPTPTINTITITNGTKEPPQNGVSSSNEHEKSSPPTLTPLQNAFPNFTETFSANGQKLPSFQSQFNAFTEEAQRRVSRASTRYQQTGSCHLLRINCTRHLTTTQPAAASPMGTREHSPFLDERHVQLFPGQVPLSGQFSNLIQNSNAHHNGYVNNHNGGFIHHHHHNASLQLQELVPVPPMILHHPVSVSNSTHKLAQQITTDGSIPGLNLNIVDPHSSGGPHGFPQNGNIHVLPETHVIAVKLQPYEHNNIQANNNAPVHHQITKMEQQSPRINGNGPQNGIQNGTPSVSTPTKKGKRKRSDTNGSMNGMNDHAHQVSSVSSTDSDFKRPNGSNHASNGKMSNGMGHSEHGDSLDKPVKKKRKRCGECIGCQRKDNCGECAPCRNDKSHQICKQRRCDKLTEKKTPKSKLKQQAQQLH
ncbi:DNA N6-methyl adenine demethylase [Orchesella cincta]|uniref:DNA N6-methyl adenine demethylase n=1 Tax=Orchesella cincta TaxID=48709 RepID=A0A1D2MIU5_ORCCI|nr:DNA N6-methyl adenine demethylase [Orchesella cincta]